VRVAQHLDDSHVAIDLLVTFDPVTPPSVPPNVKHCVNLYQSNGLFDLLPFLRGVPLKSEDKSPDQVVNGNVRGDRKDLLEPWTNHFTIEKKHKVHQEVIRLVNLYCPPRSQWIAMQSGNPIPPISEAAGAQTASDTRAPLSSMGSGSTDTQRGN